MLHMALLALLLTAMFPAFGQVVSPVATDPTAAVSSRAFVGDFRATLWDGRTAILSITRVDENGAPHGTITYIGQRGVDGPHAFNAHLGSEGIQRGSRDRYGENFLGMTICGNDICVEDHRHVAIAIGGRNDGTYHAPLHFSREGRGS